MTSLANVLPLDSQRRVEPVARQSAETQQTTCEQLKQSHSTQQQAKSQAEERLQQQLQTQLALNQRQEELMARLEEQQKALAEQYHLIREAAESIESRASRSAPSWIAVWSTSGASVRWMRILQVTRS